MDLFFKIIAIPYVIWCSYFAGIPIVMWELWGARWIKNPRVYRLTVLVIKHGPRRLAYRLIPLAEKQTHDDYSPCLPCAARNRVQQDSHTFTTGPHSDYCSKCGLDKKDWPPFCANHAVKINNPKPRRSIRAAMNKMFWS